MAGARPTASRNVGHETAEENGERGGGERAMESARPADRVAVHGGVGMGARWVVKCICPPVHRWQRLLLCCVATLLPPRPEPDFLLFSLVLRHGLPSPAGSPEKQQRQLIYSPRTLVKLIR